jgi:hypothetical protein
MHVLLAGVGHGDILNRTIHPLGSVKGDSLPTREIKVRSTTDLLRTLMILDLVATKIVYAISTVPEISHMAFLSLHYLVQNNLRLRAFIIKWGHT